MAPVRQGIQHTIAQLRGITSVVLLSVLQRNKILLLEEKKNVGVFEVLGKQSVFLATHDESFRDPVHSIVKRNKKNEVVFPSQPFSEIPGAIICSPGWKVHEYLQKEFHVQEGDASLLIGVD